jgi:N4-gp56 family major capsid protein
MDNPIFKGGAGIWDNVVIHTHPYVVTSLDGLGGIQLGHALFLGAQAACMAVAQEPDWVEDPTIDYGNKVGFKSSMIFGIQKANFNSEDFGCQQIITAAIND